jgi:L-glyceraldehyde 3-phosphate reductase
MNHLPNPARNDRMPYRSCGHSGLKLPQLSLGLWHNFGHATPFELQREMVRTAFDLGITHFDLANNYGPPAGSSETNFGRILGGDLKAHRDELIVSTKAGWEMWPGPYGRGGGSRKHVLSSLDQSLQRLDIDYVDIFYSHRFDADTPLEETAAALATAVRQGKALYAARKTAEMGRLLGEQGVPCLIHQPSYNMFNRWIEHGLLDTLAAEGMGCITFTALAQGLLTDKYLGGIPQDSRINRPGGSSLTASHLSEVNLAKVKALNGIAVKRGQSLAQMALAWVLRDARVTSTLIGASSVAQIRENVAALDKLEFSTDELGAIDRHAQEGGVDLWRSPSTDQRV